VGKQDFKLVDTSRPTAANGDIPKASERILKTTVWYPARRRSLERLHPGPAPLAEGACPCPLVTYSHGFMSFRSSGAYLAKYLASHGYVVTAANFPLTHFGTAGGPQFRDVLNQPADVSFLIDTLLAWSDDPYSRFAAQIDRQRIGAVGLSLGGMTTTLLAFHPSLRDARVGAAVSIAGPSAMFDERFFVTAAVPFMMIAGDIDAMVDYSSNASSLQERAPRATLVTLQGGSHTGFSGISALLLRWFKNPDSMGCWALRRGIDEQMVRKEQFADLITAMGGEAAGIRNVGGVLPCRGSSLPRALRPQRQQALTKFAVFAFLQSEFHPDAAVRDEYARVLNDALARENPEIEVSAARSYNH
jgi:predicted dienelactone hydrolase